MNAVLFLTFQDIPNTILHTFINDVFPQMKLTNGISIYSNSYNTIYLKLNWTGMLKTVLAQIKRSLIYQIYW